MSFASKRVRYAVGVVLAIATVAAGVSEASFRKFWRRRHACQCSSNGYGKTCQITNGIEWTGEPGGMWYWQRSPDEEKRMIMGLYNRYCIRCHGVDGRGVWDIPDVPDFTNARWQASRSDAQLARATLEGRGAVMPPFRGTLTLEEAWGMARYLRTLLPGTEVSRPEFDRPEPAATTP
jgi:mono/diheme cytochrome c family protein